MQVDEAQAGSSVILAEGELLIVRLKENASTGYRWAVEQTGGLAWEDSGSGPAGVPGGAGIHEFRARADRVGRHDICLKHWRDWEGERGIIARFPLTLQVQPIMRSE
ncbi:protease inhibitor I42 family protein [Pseudoduganella sp. S-14]|jgi:predicted secreted protein|uniref:protease inhibitor I42 family protein n=1 Tax=Pseudoduganella sp. S-14 TaxID=3404065 RepID=UPI003CE9E340